MLLILSLLSNVALFILYTTGSKDLLKLKRQECDFLRQYADEVQEASFKCGYNEGHSDGVNGIEYQADWEYEYQYGGSRLAELPQVRETGR